jgi:hypothetical protein
MDRAAEEGTRRALLGGRCTLRTSTYPPHTHTPSPLAAAVLSAFCRLTEKRVPSFSTQLLAVLGGQFRVSDEICGCVLSVRYQEDILSVWNRSADSRRVCMQIRDTMRSVMGLPADATMEYKKHTDSMRDNSSYRNTQSNF